MPSIFTKIINGEIPCYKVAEDERFFAFLDHLKHLLSVLVRLNDNSERHDFGLSEDSYTNTTKKRVACSVANIEELCCCSLGRQTYPAIKG